jgi:hypothetical protein
MKDTLIFEKGGHRDSWQEENFSIIHATFPFVRGRHSTLLNRIVFHDSACVVLHYSVFLIQQLDRMLGMEKNLLQFLGHGRHLPLVQELLNRSNHWSDRG